MLKAFGNSGHEKQISSRMCAARSLTVRTLVGVQHMSAPVGIEAVQVLMCTRDL